MEKIPENIEEIPIEELKKIVASLARETFEKLLLFLPGEQHYKEILISTAMEFAGDKVIKKVEKRLDKFTDKLNPYEQVAFLAEELYFFCSIYARLYVFHKLYLELVVKEKKQEDKGDSKDE